MPAGERGDLGEVCGGRDGAAAPVVRVFEADGAGWREVQVVTRADCALDGVEGMNHMVNMMREHVPSSTRIHYVITNGGKAPNIVPDYAEV
jgi:hypothetical protein